MSWKVGAHRTGASGSQSSPWQAALGFASADRSGSIRSSSHRYLVRLSSALPRGRLFADLVRRPRLACLVTRNWSPLLASVGQPLRGCPVAGRHALMSQCAQTHPVGIADVVHDIPHEPLRERWARCLAARATQVTLRSARHGGHGDVPVALPAGPGRVPMASERPPEADGRSRVSAIGMADEPSQAECRDRQPAHRGARGGPGFRLMRHDHRFRTRPPARPASRPRARHRDHVLAAAGRRARHAWHAHVNERLAPEEVQTPPRKRCRDGHGHRPRSFAAPRYSSWQRGSNETRREPDRDMQFPPAVLLATKRYARDPPRIRTVAREVR